MGLGSVTQNSGHSLGARLTLALLVVKPGLTLKFLSFSHIIFEEILSVCY